MRNFFFMVFCMVALLLPQSSWADAVLSDNGKTLTITTTTPGQVSGYVDALDLTSVQKAAITKIVLDGYFNSDDLNAIKGNVTSGEDGPFTGVTTVDMSEAKFEYASAEGVPEFGSQTLAGQSSTVNVGTIIKDLSNGRYYEAKTNTSTWSLVGDSDTPNYNNGSYYGVNTREGLYYFQDTNTPKTYAHGTLAAMGTAYTYETEKWNDITSTTIFPISFTDRQIYSTSQTPQNDRRTDQDSNEAPEDGKLYFSGVVYYSSQSGDNWVWTTSQSYWGYNISGKVYANADAMNADAPTGNNQWAVVISTVYQYSAAGWKEAPVWVYGNTFSPKVKVYTGIGDFPGTPANGDRAFAGTYYKFNRSFSWDEATPTGASNYSMMKFTYWSETLVTAKTSKYADANISDQIFQDCKKITRIEFLGGHVKELYNRTAGENNYANFTLFVGKNVTEIEPGALNQSTALTGLEFDRNYQGLTSEELANYPKELTIGNMAFNGCYNVFNIVIPNRCISIGNNAFKNVGNGANLGNAFTNIANQELTLTFERRNSADDSGVGINCEKPLVIGNSAFQDCWYLKNLSLPIRLNTMGEDCFKNTYSLKTLVMREETNSDYNGDLLRTIPSGAFESSGIEEVIIPKCVTLIQDRAFGSTTSLKKVTFQTNTEPASKLPDNTLIVKSGAFRYGTEAGRPQLDVYVMVNPEVRKIVCEYQAFNFTQTVGQTNTSTTNPSFAYLHFPEEYWDYYQGNWKRGLVFSQNNLNAMKDGYNGTNNDYTCNGKSSDTINRNTGKYEDSDANDNTIYAPSNGWQEFARTSTSIDIEIPTGSFLRSFSTKKPLAIPVYATGTYVGQPMFDIYRISAFSYVENNSSATATKVEVHTGNNSEVTTDLYVPKGSGFLMVGKGDGGYLLYMKELNEDVTTAATYPFTAEGVNPNLLYPTCLDEQFVRPASWPAKAKTPTLVNDGAGVMLYPTIPHPYSPSKAPLQYRLFGLTKVAGHQGQFDRIAEETVVTRDKAYLRLTPTQFPSSNEGSYGGGDSGLGNNLGSAPIMLSFMDPEGNTTDVRMIDSQTMTIMEDCYYTLQGVKLNTRPTQKGIYIHNGKKVVIK